MKRTVSRQRPQGNSAVQDLESHCRVTYYYAFLHHTVAHIQNDFPPKLAGALLSTYLLPCNLTNVDQIECELIKEFEQFIPCFCSFLSVLSTWRVHLAESDNTGSDLATIARFAHNNCAWVFYPNDHAMLLLLLTFSVRSCTCE